MVILYQTQDPWMDIGLIALHRVLEWIEEEEPGLIDRLELTSSYLTFSLDKEGLEDFRDHFYSYIKEKINSILLPSAELKLLGNQQWSKKNEDGFLNVKYQLKLSKEDLEFIKNQTNDQGKPYLKNPNKDVEVQCSRNYIGLKVDWSNLSKNYKKEIDSFIQQLFYAPTKGKRCPLCGLEAESEGFYSMNQSKNMLFNQHHNVPVRGYKSRVTKESMCSICNMLNLLAILQVDWHPYFISDKMITHLLVPETTNLISLSNLIKAISQNGLYQNLAQTRQVLSYQTNITKLKHRTLYTSLLQLYFWMNYVEKEAGFVRYPLEKQDRTSLKGWLIPRFTKGQNVIFKEFTRLSTNEDLFFLTLMIPFGKDSYEGDVVHDFINQIRSDDDRRLDQIAEGIVRKDIGKIAKNLFEIYKKALDHPRKYHITTRGCLFFKDYLPYFYQYIHKEEAALLSDQLHEDLRLLGKAIGQYTDLSVLNKLNTASSLEMFVAALKEAVFKIYKQQLSHKKEQKSLEEIHNIGTKRMQHILTQTNEQNLMMIRDTLMIYSSLSAFQENNKKNREKESIEA